MKPLVTPTLILALALSLVSCSSKQTVSIHTGTGSRESVDVTAFTNPIHSNGVFDPQHGRELYLGICPLAGTNGALANGVAIAHYFADKGTIVTLQLNIAAAKTGTFYEGWLENDDRTDRVSLGNLGSYTNDVQHSLQFNTPKDLSKLLNVVVSLQTNGADDGRDTIVAIGRLKPTRR